MQVDKHVSYSARPVSPVLCQTAPLFVHMEPEVPRRASVSAQPKVDNSSEPAAAEAVRSKCSYEVVLAAIFSL